MSKSNLSTSVTNQDLVKAMVQQVNSFDRSLKKTARDLNRKIDEAVDAILHGMDGFQKQNAKEHAEICQELASFREENAGQHSHMRDDINYLKGEVSALPLRVEKLEKTVFSN